LRRLGFEIAREGKHTIFVRAGLILSIPRHATVRRKLLLTELRRLGITQAEFMDKY